MKKLLLSILFVGAAVLAKAQKSEIAEAKTAWNIFQFKMSQDPDAPKRSMPRSGGAPSAPISEKIESQGKATSRIGKTEAPSGSYREPRPAQTANAAPAKMSFVERQIASLNEGMAHADKAIVHEKTKDNPEAWVYKALFTSAIALVDTLNLQNSLAKQKDAEEAIAKTKALDPKGTEKDNIATAEMNIVNALRVRGKNAFDKKDFASAYSSFSQLAALNPQDTSMYVNMGVTAKMMNKYPDAIANFKKAIALNSPDSKMLYGDAINMTLENLKDTVAGLALTKEAMAKFPDESSFIGVETDLYIAKGDIAKSQELLTKLIASDGKNALYQYLMGDTYYKQALNIQTQRNKLDTKKVKEFDALSAKMVALIDQSIPYYKKSLDINPVFVPALETLKQIYAFKGDNDKYNEIKKKLDAIPAN